MCDSRMCNDNKKMAEPSIEQIINLVGKLTKEEVRTLFKLLSGMGMVRCDCGKKEHLQIMCPVCLQTLVIRGG